MASAWYIIALERAKGRLFWQNTSEMGGTPLYSIIIPARDEEAQIPLCLQALRLSFCALQDSVTYEIIVVINRCTDRTEEIARAAGCRIVREDQKNLARIRNAGAREAFGINLIFVDADSRVSPSLAKVVSRSLEDPRVLGGGVLILPERWSLGIFATMLLLLPIAVYYRISAGLFFVRRECFEAIGGFNEELSSVEDIDFAKRLKAYAKQHGLRFSTLLRAWIVTSCRKFDRLGDWYFIRNFRETAALLRGRDQKAADKIWYDFPRE